MNEQSQQRLEKLIERTLRAQPLRSAPASLEQRVLGELRARAARPWWQQSFLHWPLAARAALVVVCALVARLCMGVSVWMGASAPVLATPQVVSRSFTWSQKLIGAAGAVRDILLLIVHALPTQWLVIALALAAIFYTVFFGLCATAYRTLFVQPAFQR